MRNLAGCIIIAWNSSMFIAVMERYIKILKSYKRMPSEMETMLRENVFPLAIRKDEILQPVGTIKDNLYFVEKGLLHLFVLRQGEKQVTLRFKKKDDFIIALK